MNALLRLTALVVLTSVALRAEAPGPVIGIGTELKSVHGQAVVAQIIPGSPADQAGIRPGDRIIRVDDTNVEKMSLPQIAHLLHGASNSSVRVTVNRGGGRKEFELKRAILTLTGTPANP